ncbi:MAG: DegV family protein [Methylocystaceae bacterium]
MAIKLVTDSTSNLDQATLKELDIKVIPLTVHFPTESFKENEISCRCFYDKLSQSPVIPTSSQPSPGEIEDVFSDLVASGDDVLGVFISSGVSGTYENAMSARHSILSRLPQAKIEIVDSLTTAMALGIVVLEAAREVQIGCSFNEVVATARHLVDRVSFNFIPVSLEYLRKGGRIGGATALLGSLLDIKPILYYNNGKTAVRDKVRSTKAAISRMISFLERDYHNTGLKYVIVQHINNLPGAREVAALVRERLGVEPSIIEVFPVVGMHVGPGSVGIIYCLEG